MGFFSIFRKKQNSNELELVPLVSEKIEIPEEIVIDEPGIVEISSGNVIDTTSREALARYKHNVELLRRRVKETGNIGNLVTIRNDDIFPDDFVWRENSSNTYSELTLPKFGYELKRYIIEDKYRNKNFDTFFPVPVSDETIFEEMKKFDKDFGKIITPTKFRTTKHFTINTPLGYTGSYNFVKSDRKYTIIDDAKGLIDSPYTYTISGRDSFLDVTHEGLPISKDAIILISEEYFNEVKTNKELLNKLFERNLMVYRGNLDTAINMIMSERGILPFVPGERMEYDGEVDDIIKSNLESICDSHGYDYEVGHGNLFGKGGHFTDLIDGDVNLVDDSLIPFIEFLNLNSGLDYQITTSTISHTEYLYKLFKEMGVDKVISIIEAYNTYMKSIMDNKLNEYSHSRDAITLEESELFSSTVIRINNFFKTNTPKDDIELWRSIVAFYSDPSIDNQIEYANMINDRLNSLERN